MTSGMIKSLFEGLASAKIKRSALSGFYTSCLYITVPVLFILPFMPDKLQYPVLVLGFIPVCILAFAGIFLLYADRDRLHTEEYLERRHAMEIVETKSEGVLLKEVDIVNVLNPDLPRKAIQDGKKTLSEVEEVKR